MSIGMGAGSWLGVSTALAGQAAWNTASPGSFLYFPALPGGVGMKNEAAFSGQARGPDPIHGRGGLLSADGSEVFEVYPHNLDYFLANFFSLAQTNPSGTIYEHTWTIPPLLDLKQPHGLTLREGMGTALTSDTTKQLTSVFVSGLQFAVVGSNFLTCTVAVMAAGRAFTTQTPTFGTQVPFTVSGNLTVDLTTYDAAGAEAATYSNLPVRGLSINLGMPGRLDYSDTSTTAAKFSRTDKVSVDVSWNWDFLGATEPDPSLRTAFDVKRRLKVVATLTGADLGGGSLETLRFTFTNMLRSGADPVLGGAGPFVHTVNLKGQRDIASGTGAVVIFSRNSNQLT